MALDKKNCCNWNGETAADSESQSRRVRNRRNKKQTNRGHAMKRREEKRASECVFGRESLKDVKDERRYQAGAEIKEQRSLA